MPVPYQTSHHSKVLKILLYLLIFVMVVYISIDYKRSIYLMVFMEVIIVIFSLSCLWNFDKWFTTKSSQTISVVMMNFMLIFFMYTLTTDIFQTNNLWVFVIPIMTYMFIGLKWGKYVTAFYVSIALFIINRNNQTLLHGFPVEAYIDVGLILITIWIVTHQYEKANETSKRQLHELATKDSLTKLYNRHAFYNIAKKNHNKVMSIIVIDLDWFKNINDTYGHDGGDYVLQQVAIRLEELSPESNIFRMGGEEFAILLPNYELQQAVDFAEKALNSLRNTPLSFKNQSINITASIGVAYCEAGFYIDQLMSRADKHLYQAKENGRDYVVHK